MNFSSATNGCCAGKQPKRSSFPPVAERSDSNSVRLVDVAPLPRHSRDAGERERERGCLAERMEESAADDAAGLRSGRRRRGHKCIDDTLRRVPRVERARARRYWPFFWRENRGRAVIGCRGVEGALIKSTAAAWRWQRCGRAAQHGGDRIVTPPRHLGTNIQRE